MLQVVVAFDLSGPIRDEGYIPGFELDAGDSAVGYARFEDFRRGPSMALW